jgi:hypothetical protein
MYGHLMYEIAKQRIADQQRAAQQAHEAREARAQRTAARKRGRQETVIAPAIPDFAHEMFDVTREAIPAPRQEDAGGRRAGSNR